MQPIDLVEVAPGEFAPDTPMAAKPIGRLTAFAFHAVVVISAAIGIFALDKWVGQ